MLKNNKTHTPLDPYHLPFQQYLTDTHRLLEEAHRNAKDAAIRIAANSPFEWRPHTAPVKKGVLLVHGLLDSPYSLCAIGKIFLQNNFLVRSILLPGHGTCVEDLLTVSHQDWLDTTHYAIQSLQQEVDELFLVGFSAGSSLSLIHTPSLSKLKGVVLLAPAMALRSKFVAFSGFLNFLGNFYPPLKWHEKKPELDYAKYQSLPYQLANQAYKLCQLNQRVTSTHHLPCPLMMMISDADETISPQKALDYFFKQPSEKNRCVIYSKEPSIYASLSSKIIARSATNPLYNILDYSHVCLSIPMDDPHYGLHGDYLPPLEGLISGDEKTTIMRGALSKENLQKYAMRRLYFNPDFPFLSQQIEAFIHSCASAPCDLSLAC